MVALGNNRNNGSNLGAFYLNAKLAYGNRKDAPNL